MKEAKVTESWTCSYLTHEQQLCSLINHFEVTTTRIEKELDIDNKLHNYLKITGILNNVFRPQKNS